MTTLCVCAVWDSAVQAYHRPMFVPHTGGAVRAFADEVNRKDAGNTLNAHPSDYELHQLGIWDENTGSFLNSSDGQLDVVLVRGKDVIKG